MYRRAVQRSPFSISPTTLLDLPRGGWFLLCYFHVLREFFISLSFFPPRCRIGRIKRRTGQRCPVSLLRGRYESFLLPFESECQYHTSNNQDHPQKYAKNIKLCHHAAPFTSGSSYMLCCYSMSQVHPSAAPQNAHRQERSPSFFNSHGIEPSGRQWVTFSFLQSFSGMLFFVTGFTQQP